MGAGARECRSTGLDRVIGARPVSARNARAYPGVTPEGAARAAWGGVRGVRCDCLSLVACGRVHIGFVHPHRRCGTQRKTELSANATRDDGGIRRISSCRQAEGARIIMSADQRSYEYWLGPSELKYTSSG